MKMLIGCAQLNSGDDRIANLQSALQVIHHLAEQGAHLVMLPEQFAFIGPDEQKVEQAEPLQSASWLPQISNLAVKKGIHVHIGSFLEKDGEDIYNTAVVIGPNGTVVATYRKIHLFDVQIPGGTTYHESRVISPGNQLATFAVGPFVFGLATCYDLRFPELFRALVEHGANVLLVPAAFTLQTGRDHWEILLRARAIENQCWVAAAGQWGTAPPSQLLFGRSMVINPWGLVIAQAGDGVTTITAELDLQVLHDIRTRFPALAHRRRDLFSGDTPSPAV